MSDRVQSASSRPSVATLAARVVIAVRRSAVLQGCVAAAVFALVTVGYFNPVFRAGATYSSIAGNQGGQYPWAAQPTGVRDTIQADQANYIYPIEVDVGRELGHGVLAGWNPTSFGGLPTAGSAYSQMSYPGHLVSIAVFGPSWAHDVFLMLHVWLAGLSMFWLLRVLRASWWAAVFGGVTWMLCPAWFGLAQLESTPVLAALLPAALASGLLAVRRRSLRLVGLCALLQALLILGASIQYGVFTAPLVALAMLLDGVVWAPSLRLRERVLPAAYALLACGLGAGIAAFVLVPERAALAESRRAKVPYDFMAAKLGLSARRVGELVSPSPPAITGRTIWTLLFLGSAGGVLLLVGLVSRRPGAWLGRSVTLVFVVLILATPLTWLAYHVIPGFAFLTPLGRLMPLAALGAVILAALGADALLDLVRRLPRRVELATSVLGTALVLLQAFQLAAYDRQVNPGFQAREQRVMFPPTPLLDALAANPGVSSRIIPVRPAVVGSPTSIPMLVGDVPMLFGLRSIGGYFNVIPPRAASLALYLGGAPLRTALTPLAGAYPAWFYAGTVRYDLLERLGVTAIVADPRTIPDTALAAGLCATGARVVYAGPDGVVYGLPHPLQRAFVATSAAIAHGEADALARYASPAFPFRTTVLLERGRPLRGWPRRGGTSPRPYDRRGRRSAPAASRHAGAGLARGGRYVGQGLVGAGQRRPGCRAARGLRVPCRRGARRSLRGGVALPRAGARGRRRGLRGGWPRDRRAARGRRRPRPPPTPTVIAGVGAETAGCCDIVRRWPTPDCLGAAPRWT